jgi:hypothetical protein
MERDKHKLEGLLKARSADMGRRRRRIQPQVAPIAAPVGPIVEGEPAPSRPCGDCGGEISLRRLRAMPSALRCLDCQRAFENG